MDRLSEQTIFFTYLSKLILGLSLAKFIDGHIVAQMEQVLKNLRVIIEAGGSSMACVIKTVIFLKDIKAFRHSKKNIRAIF
jgi:enamine deaminase RidA (YjgF/YER057c/UK114 family)